MRRRMARCSSASTAATSAAATRTGSKSSPARAWSRSIAMAAYRNPSGRCFAFVQTVDDQPRARLVDTLRQQGMQPRQQVVFLSDGAETLRPLQQNIAPEAEHVLDWFHVSMRLTVLGQMIKGAWTDTATVGAKAAAMDRIKWLLWHGNAPDAVDDIECLVDDVTAELEDNPTSASLRKLAAALSEFAT